MPPNDVGVLRPVPPWGHGAPAWPYFEDVQIERLHGMAKSRVLTQRSPPSCIPAPTSTRRRTGGRKYRFWTRSVEAAFFGTGVVSDPEGQWGWSLAEDLQNYPDIRPGDIVVVNTGWYTNADS